MLPLDLCALQPVTLTPSELRWDLLNVGIAVLLLAIGLAAIGLFFFRAKSRDLSLVYFGLFTMLYAIRLLANRLIIESVFDVPRIFWDDINWAISCTIVIPFGLFLYQLVGHRLKKLFRLVIATQVICAVLEGVAAVFGASTKDLNLANNVVTLGTVIPGMIAIVFIRWRTQPRPPITREVRVFIGGFLFWFLFIVQANLSSLGGRVPRFEFLGFLVFVGCLGYIVARRTVATEERLIAINQELGTARAIQSSLLPRNVPKLDGLTLAARYVPMSQVAGDFYDFIVDGQKHVGILIADVSGHGVPAALIASMIKVAFAGQTQHGRDPARVLTGLNLALCGKFEEHYVTAAYVFVDIENKVLRYGGAGHPPILLASRSSGTVRRIEENGTILGLIPNAPYTACEVRLHAGDRILLYTDGVFEAMDAANKEFGKDRLEQFLKANSVLSADSLSTALLDELSRWSGHSEGGQDDDITFVVADLKDEPEPHDSTRAPA